MVDKTPRTGFDWLDAIILVLIVVLNFATSIYYKYFD